jgi:hypothetical protein
VLAAAPGSRSGMPSHLPWLLRAVLPSTLLVIADAADVPDAVTSVELHSDGVTARSTWR